jgi:hypothetical protein
LRIQFRNFQSGDDLSAFDPIANIDVDTADVSGNLCMQIDFLIRLKAYWTSRLA